MILLNVWQIGVTTIIYLAALQGVARMASERRQQRVSSAKAPAS
jgi:ABC-type sugar transport system permease subunit